MCKDRDMPVQDDERENQMIALFNLIVPENRGRSDIDARLDIDGHVINFELKSTTSGSVSTVRDFGADHIKKWRDGLHWIFAFYNADGARLKHCIYASPDDMEPWIAEKENYIKPDLLFADSLPASVTIDMVKEALGAKDVYTKADARWIMKNQWREADYREQQDLPDGYSVTRMSEIMQLRSRYVILRGATLNNPHIERGFFEKFPKITSEHAGTLRKYVRAYLDAKAVATDRATA
jgi:hypothetical protein